ncbi:class I SAM-dependent methyltransferase [Nocardioides bizhenqiangii]|uniref:Methyltransferase domain-containing protein n=1 Tax=Nocardioides bizhenqiangii TaxID=3095076 RepID=A0ABZ0ZMA9_9ACTN|nr:MULTISPECIES: methyltransferase domain-containing protein [unclassified Nocardioides]MDZ5621225.1 methyltransferase domain-containing protein [Nocardioides sp. HM23]WQQ25481.1 methyltransferase domain-containing protein [Nocardioides sp. HM61]
MASSPPAELTASDRGITLRGDLDVDRTYDVVINGLHVWSLQPERDMQQRQAAYVCDWPKALTSHLNGTADIELRDHVTQDLIGSTSARLGDGDDPIAVRNKDGRPLILDKWGRMIVRLDSEGSQQVDELMKYVVDLLDALQNTCGVPAYVAYGTLLGAVRNGQLIGYDNDVDLAYVASHETPVDIVRESFRIQRTLTEHGWLVRRGSGSRLNVRVPMEDGSVRHIDIFTAFWIGDTFHTAVDIGCRMSREDVLPVSYVDLCGHRVAAPANPAAILAAAYGEGWRVPDPAFQYDSPTWLKRRFSGFFGGYITHRKRWDAFNASHGKRLVKKPSPFAHWVHSEFPSDATIVDAGCGGGRDSRLFARSGRTVLGVDYSLGAVMRANRWAARRATNASFEPVNFYDTRAVLAMGARLSREERPVDVYARFLLHALEDRGRANFWRMVSMSLRSGGRLFLEFRTERDARNKHFFGKHFRRYLDPDLVQAEIEANGGRVVHREAGTGLAPFRSEDPHVCRIVATWA